MNHRIFFAVGFFLLFAFDAPKITHAAALSGFDGHPWGTPAAAISGESREIMGGAILAKRTALPSLKKTYRLNDAYKIYYFCGGVLCGGKLSLIFNKGFREIGVSRAMTQMKAIVGTAYGHLGEPGRVGDGLWSVDGGFISAATVIKGNRSLVEVFYRGPEYLKTLADSERGLNAELNHNLWGFRF
ncbi:MAG: hypothetical protein WD407_05895 [Rhodospirillales bacterium]